MKSHIVERTSKPVFPIMPWVSQSVESNCGAWLQRLQPRQSREIILEYFGPQSKSLQSRTQIQCALLVIDSVQAWLISNEPNATRAEI